MTTAKYYSPPVSISCCNSKPTQNKKKRVEFARSTEEFAPSDFDESLTTRWYQHADYETFRNQSAADAETIVSQMHALTKCVSHAYKSAARIALNASDEFSLMEPLKTVGPNFQLLLWCNAACARSNEKSVLNSLAVENVSRIRANHRSLILASQRKIDGHKLRMQSEQVTRKSRVFAHMMGLADACIALRPDNTCKTQSVQGENHVVDNKCQLPIRGLDHGSTRQLQICALQA